MSQDVLLVGDNHLTQRLLSRLEPAGYRGTIQLDSLPSGTYAAIVVATDDDGHNLELALAALERFPDTPLVVRIDSPSLAEGLQERLPAATIVCPPDIAAPSFAAAAIHPSLRGALHLGGDLQVLWETDRPPEGSQVIASDADDHLVLAPWRTVREHLSRDGGSMVDPTHANRRPFRPFHLDPVLKLGLGAFFGILAFGTLYFAHSLNLTLLDSLYFTVATLTSVGYGDISLLRAATQPKVTGILLMVAGSLSLMVMTAYVTNQVLSRREALLRGHRRSRLSGHIVVCGMGRLGSRVIEILHRMGETVLAIEPQPDPVIATDIRQRGIHVIEADASHPETLAFANLPRAKSLVVVAGHDLVNIRIALASGAFHASIPMVMRLFAPDLAHRAERFLGFGRSLSASRLAAESMLAALLKDERLCLVAEWRGRLIELLDDGNGRCRVRRATGRLG